MSDTLDIMNPEADFGLEDQLDEFFASQLERSAQISPYYNDLWSEMGRLSKSGGKRLRPRMAVLAYCMLGGQDVKAILPAVAALEVLHLGMLIQDDIIDRDYTRYGVDNVAGRYFKTHYSHLTEQSDRRHFAHGTAMLAGDLLLSASYNLMAQSEVEAGKILEIQALLGDSIFQVIGGELLDTESVFRRAGDISAIDVALHKTASYSCVLPLLTGAKLAGMAESDQDHVRALGSSLGIAFQLRDDVLGVFGDKAETGKTIIGDIREGKRTYMVEQFYELANPQQRAEFDRSFGNSSIKLEEASRLRDLLEISGALDHTERAIADYQSKAQQALGKIPIDPAYRDQVDYLVRTMAVRAK